MWSVIWLSFLPAALGQGYTGHATTTAEAFFANEQRCLLRLLGTSSLHPVGESSSECEDLDGWNIPFEGDSEGRGDEILANRDEYIMARFSAFAQYWFTGTVAPWPGLLPQTPSNCVTLRELIWVYLFRALSFDATGVEDVQARYTEAAGMVESLWAPYMQHLGVWCTQDRELNWFVLAYVFFITLLVVGIVTYCGPRKR